MADYKRMVSYMYQYENGVKRKNVGFVRVEAKGGQCKITLHMQLLGQLDSIFPTYLIQRSNNNLELIYLGDTVLKNQVMDSRLSADENNIMGSGYRLSDMGGLLLFLNDNVFFATGWDDKQVVASEVLEALRPKKGRQAVSNKQEVTPGIFQGGEDETVQGQQEKTLEEELKIPTYQLPGGWKMVERLMVPGNRGSESVQLVDNYDDEIQEEIARLNNMEEDDSIQELVQPELYEENTIQDQDFSERAYEPDTDNQQEMQQEIPEEIQQEVQQGFQQETQRGLQQQMQQGFQQETQQGLQQQMQQGFQQDMQQDYYQDVQQEMQQEVQQGDQQDLHNDSTDGMQQIESTVREEENAAYTNLQYTTNSTSETGPSCLDDDGIFMDPPTAKQILDHYPKIYPFEDNEIIKCVKIEPKDIGLLPKEVWPLSNNSFLMHGYYCYHHLIFAKMKNRFGCGYILGIPGIFHGREQFMARMFGFESFKSIRKRELKQGDFGYWYIPVYL